MQLGRVSKEKHEPRDRQAGDQNQLARHARLERRPVRPSRKLAMRELGLWSATQTSSKGNTPEGRTPLEVDTANNYLGILQ